MSEPIRYNLENGGLYRNKNGDYIEADEYDRLRAENAELREELRSTKELQRLTRENRDFLSAECANLEDANRELRAKMATMVCRDCLGSKHAMTYTSDGKFMNGIGPCPVCQPNGGT